MVSASPPTNQDVDVPRRLREKDRGLSGRIAAADDDHFVAAADLRLHERRAVVDARALELREPVE